MKLKKRSPEAERAYLEGYKAGLDFAVATMKGEPPPQDRLPPVPSAGRPEETRCKHEKVVEGKGRPSYCFDCGLDLPPADETPQPARTGEVWCDACRTFYGPGFPAHFVNDGKVHGERRTKDEEE